jgi:hypothetical protein
VADVEPHAKLRFRCRVCGGPRVPLDDPEVVRTGRERPLLTRAQTARMREAAFKLGSASVGGFGLLSLLISLVVLGLVSPGLFATLASLLVVAVPFAVAFFAWRRAQRHAKEIEHSLDDAWALVASDLLRQRGTELTAAELATAMRSSEQQAELVLARLNVDDLVRARVTEDGEIAYSTGALAPPRARIIAGPEEAELAADEESRSELEQRKTVVDNRTR